MYMGAGVLDCFHSINPATVGVPQCFYVGCPVSVWGRRWWKKKYVKLAELTVTKIHEKTKQLEFSSPLPKKIKRGDLILLGGDSGMGLERH